jgi:hypothetical protein
VTGGTVPVDVVCCVEDGSEVKDGDVVERP